MIQLILFTKKVGLQLMMTVVVLLNSSIVDCLDISTSTKCWLDHSRFGSVRCSNHEGGSNDIRILGSSSPATATVATVITASSLLPSSERRDHTAYHIEIQGIERIGIVECEYAQSGGEGG